jgi:hypothetical protein
MKNPEHSKDFYEAGCTKAFGPLSYIEFRVNTNHNLWLVFRDRRAEGLQASVANTPARRDSDGNIIGWSECTG